MNQLSSLFAFCVCLAAASLSAATLLSPPASVPELMQAKKAGRPSVSLYVEAQFKGRLTRIKAPCEYVNEVVLKSELGISNDSILSIKVPAGVKVTVFDGPNFRGDSATFNEGEHATLGSLAHRVTSLKVEMVREQ